jgi:hypothetical protein
MIGEVVTIPRSKLMCNKCRKHKCGCQKMPDSLGTVNQKNRGFGQIHQVVLIMKTKLAVLIGLVAIIAYGAFSAVDSDGLPAWWLYRGVATVSASLKSLQDALTPPPLRIFDTVYGPMKAQMLHVAVHFQVSNKTRAENLFKYLFIYQRFHVSTKHHIITCY